MTSRYTFVCPECEQEIEVDEPMRESILSSGCPVCAGATDSESFELR